MSGYTPLFNSIVMSSIWDENNETRIVWITMLALAGADGVVEGSITGLAHSARVSVEACRKALEKLQAPDPYSRTSDDKGRRIKEIDGGWLILNHKKYREKAKSRAAYYRDWREKKKVTKEENKDSNSDSYSNSNSETTCNTQSVAQPVSFYTLEQVKDACVMNGIPETNAQSYFDQYNSQDWKKGNGQMITNLQSHMAKRWNKNKECWDFDETRTKQDGSKNVRAKKYSRDFIRRESSVGDVVEM